LNKNNSKLLNTTKNSHFTGLINRPVPKKNSKTFPSISLFSGILGIETGLEYAGFKTKFALDICKDAKDVIEENREHFGNFPYVCDSITTLPPKEILKQCGLQSEEVAILAGGPPCQPFSKSGMREGTSDNRGLLFKHYIEYLKVIRPQSFLLENVRGLYSSRGNKDFKLIIEEFDKTGYSVYWKTLDAANYGVPQFRQRLFIVGFRDRVKFDFPHETHWNPEDMEDNLFHDHYPFMTVWDAIGDLNGKVKGPQHTGRYNHLLPDIPEGMNYSFYTSERGHPNPIFGWRTKFWYFLLKIDRNRPSLTIQAYPGNNTGPFHWENRRLSVEELKRLQTLPDWLTINKSYMVSHRLIGNCVPPLLAECLGREIMKALKRNTRINKSEYLRLRLESLKNGAFVKSGRGSGRGRSTLTMAGN